MGCGASKGDSGGKKAAGNLKKLDAIDIKNTGVKALDSMFGKVKDPMQQIVEINNAVYDAVTTFVNAAKKSIDGAADLASALKELYKQLKASNVILEVAEGTDGVPEFTLLDAKKNTPIVGSGALSKDVEEIWDALKSLPAKFKKIYDSMPPIKNQIEALVEEVKVFTPEKIKESVEAANLGFLEKAGAIKDAGMNVKEITRLPDVIKSVLDNVKATVEQIQSVLNSAKELVEGTGDAAPATTTTTTKPAATASPQAGGKAVKA